MREQKTLAQVQQAILQERTQQGYEGAHMIELPEQAASLHMAHAILWTNGTVTCFDDRGEQMPAYQGTFEVKAPLINAVYRGAWKYGDWNAGIIAYVPLPMIERAAYEKRGMR